MPADTICYYASDMGIEMVFCENSSICYPLHSHISVYTVGIVLDGAILLTVDDEVKSFEKNQTFVISPYMPHSISAESRYSLLSVCIDKCAAKQGDTDRICRHITALLMRAPFAEKIGRNQISEVFGCLKALSLCNDRYCESRNPFIKRLKRELEMYPESRMSVAEMAQNAFFSKYHFIRSFKEEVGLTPHQFQLQNRIRKAKHLLRMSETTAKAALDAGFCDQSHFIKQFEKQVGLSPMTYKSSCQTVSTGQG